MAPQYCLTKLDSGHLGNHFPRLVRIDDNVPCASQIVTSWLHLARLRIVSPSLRVLLTVEPFMEHAIHKPIESRRAYQHRRHTIGFAMILALTVAVALTLLLLG